MVFSGSGRHRRPTQADRAVAAAGVAGAGLALPLLTATGAHAVPVSGWESVAQCASDGNWKANAGNGLYGGLQISLHTWVSYGGDQYAAEPDHATKEQQIAVAERILAGQGPTAWPVCASTAGLDGQGPAPQTGTSPASPAPGAPTSVDPATTNPAATPPSAQPTAPTGPASASPSPSVSPDPAASTPPAPAAPTTSVPAAPVPTPTPAPPASPSATVPGTPASAAPGVGAAANPSMPPVPLAPPATPTTPAASTGTASTYTVVPGDTLCGISDAHRLDDWHHLYQDNLPTIGGDPNLILPGQVLHLP